MKRKKEIPFKEIDDFQFFKVGGRLYLKVYSGQSIDERTGKDAIFKGGDLVSPLYRANVARI